MANFFKKALGVFLEFEEEQNTTDNHVNPPVKKTPVSTDSSNQGGGIKPASSLNSEDIERFAKHFDNLFEQANLPGPDYFEFCKMMETLEAHIPDEKARMAATFASLSIQGITKEKLIESAMKYKLIVDKDKNEFDNAVNAKASKDIESRKKEVEDLEKKVATNAELIQKLTKEITDSQTRIAVVKNEIVEEQSKLSARTGGYKIASDAMLSKINTDIQKLQNNL